MILTGSASQKGFIRQIVHEIFVGMQVLSDMDPSRSISMGLALIGHSDEKSTIFKKQVNSLLDSDILFVLKYHIVSVVDSIDATIQVFEAER